MTLAPPAPMPAPPAPPASPVPEERVAGLARLAVHPAWIVVALVAAALVHEALVSGVTNDAWWHWAAGRWMLDHHSVIRHDLFSFTVPGRPWLAEEWGFEVILAGVVGLVGGAGFWIVSAGVCVAALLMGTSRWRLLGASPLRVAGLAAVAGVYLVIGVAPRPQVLSYLFFAVLLWVISRAGRSPRILVLLPPMFCVWANVHGSFLAGLGVLALAIAVSWRSWGRGRVTAGLSLPVRPAAWALGASAGATLVNPHGPALLSYAWHVAAAPQLGAHIQEWQSPDLHSLGLLAVVMAPVLLLAGRLLLTDATLDTFDLALYAGFLLAALHAQRFLPYAGLAWCGLMAPPARLASTNRQPLGAGIRPTVLTWPLAALAAAVLLVGPHVPAGAPPRTGPGAEPVAAVQWLAGRPGRVFAEYAWDDYLIARGRPVFVDGRTDLYFGTPVLTDYLRVAGLSTPPDPVLSRWDVRYVLWPTATPLAVYLASDPHWRAVFRSGPAVVFERT